MPHSGNMRTVVSCLAVLAVSVAAGAVRAEDVVKYNFDVRDVYGNPMRGPETLTTNMPGGSRSIERTASINGNRVKLESVTEKVDQKDANTRVIERTIQRFDPTGNPAGVERQRITEVKSADGSISSVTEKYRSDVNGHMNLAEKAETVQRSAGPTTLESKTMVSRPTINGSFDVVQREDVVRNSSAQGKWSETTTIWRNGQSGFYQANRLVTNHSEQNDRATENTAEYEIGSSGTLELHQQVTKETVKSPDGSTVSSTDYFNRHAPGYAVTPDQQLALRVREIVEHKVEGNKRAVETLTVQHPSITDPTRLGPPKVVSQTVCSGACQ